MFSERIRRKYLNIVLKWNLSLIYVCLVNDYEWKYEYVMGKNNFYCDIEICSDNFKEREEDFF